MKLKLVAYTALAFIGGGLVFNQMSEAQPRGAQYEYATVRWDGVQYSNVIRPDGSVQYSGNLLGTVDIPFHTDGGALIKNRLINLLGKEGYEVVSQAEGEVILRRPLYP